MKILHIVKTNIGAKWAFDQAKWLHNNGIDIITVLPEITGGMAEKYKENGMEIIKADFSLPITKPWQIFSRSKTIKAIVSLYKPDLIHCHFVTNVFMIRFALRRSNTPRLFQVPGPLHLESWFYKRIELFLSNKYDYWAGACKKTCDIYINSGIDSKKVFLAYYGGYGGESCKEYSKKSDVLHQEFNIPNDKILIGMVSYFYKPKYHMLQFKGLKGHEDFIDALKIAIQQEPKIMGIIIGDAWGKDKKYVNKVMNYAKKRCGQNIIFTGFRNDMKTIYKELDIAVHPSHSENLGGAAESLAAEVPTICTNVGGFTDIVMDGETGYAVPSKCPKQLAEAILRMIEDNEKSVLMAKKGQSHVRVLLDIENTASKVQEIYKKILGVENG